MLLNRQMQVSMQSRDDHQLDSITDQLGSYKRQSFVNDACCNGRRCQGAPTFPQYLHQETFSMMDRIARSLAHTSVHASSRPHPDSVHSAKLRPYGAGLL